jgi:hypothetical protein
LTLLSLTLLSLTLLSLTLLSLALLSLALAAFALALLTTWPRRLLTIRTRLGTLSRLATALR